MTEIQLELEYVQLSRLIQSEANKQEINVKGYDIKIQKLVITSDDGKLRVTGELDSKWSAFFDFSAIFHFDKEQKKLQLNDMSLDLDASNFIFKGILKLAKGGIISRLEKILAEPLTSQIEGIKTKLDEEFAKAPLPNNLKLSTSTHHLNILDINPLPTHLTIDLEIEQKIKIAFQAPSV